MAAQTQTSGSIARFFCRLVVWAFGLLYLAALILLGISALAWFGFAPAPLAGVFLVVLGLPWTLAAAWFPDHLQPVVGALAPGVTLIILWTFCHWPRRRIAPQPRSGAHSRQY